LIYFNKESAADCRRPNKLHKVGTNSVSVGGAKYPGSPCFPIRAVCWFILTSLRCVCKAPWGGFIRWGAQ